MKTQEKDVNKYQSKLQHKMDEFKASMQRQMELQRHVLVEGLHRRFIPGKENVPQIKLESLAPENLWTLANILKV